MKNIYQYKLAIINDGRIIFERKNTESNDIYNIVLTKQNIELIINDMNKGYNSTDCFKYYGEKYDNFRIMYEFNILKDYGCFYNFDDCKNILLIIKDEKFS